MRFFQKDSSFYFKELFNKLREIIYNDAKDEIIEEYEIIISQKQEEIEKLRAERKKLLDIQATVSFKENKVQDEKVFTVAEPQSEYCVKQNYKELLNLLFKEPDKFKTKIELKKEAKQKNISLTQNCTLFEIAEKLITAKKVIDNSLFPDE